MGKTSTKFPEKQQSRCSYTTIGTTCYHLYANYSLRTVALFVCLFVCCCFLCVGVGVCVVSIMGNKEAKGC